MDETNTSAHATRVLLALDADRVLPIAQLFAEAGFVVTLAFSREQMLDVAASATIVVADNTVDANADALRTLAAERVCVFLTAGPTQVDGIYVVSVVDESPAATVARTLALFAQSGRTHCEHVLRWGALEMKPGQRVARWKGTPVHLTATEFEILRVLVEANGSVVSKRALQRSVWPDAVPDDGERLAAHVRRIRGHIEGDPTHPDFLLTVRGIGFRLADPLEDVDDRVTYFAEHRRRWVSSTA